MISEMYAGTRGRDGCDNFVVDTADPLSDFAGADFIYALFSQQNHLVADLDIRDVADIDCDLLHTDPPYQRSANAAHQHFPPGLRRSAQAIGIAYGQSSDCLVSPPSDKYFRSQPQKPSGNVFDLHLSVVFQDIAGCSPVRLWLFPNGFKPYRSNPGRTKLKWLSLQVSSAAELARMRMFESKVSLVELRQNLPES